MNITIVGLGLIGGSMALELRKQLGVTVFGVDHNIDHCRQAIQLGLVDEIVDLADCLKKSDVIIVSVSIFGILDLLPKLLDDCSNTQLIIDVGSTKHSVCKAVQNHPKRNRFVAAHPLAGTEYSGPSAAHKGLFEGKKNIICDKSKTDAAAVDLAVRIFDSMGLHTVFMESEEHDRHLAYVSHLSHITSFALGLTVLNIEKDETQISNLASTGFASTARLAKSSPTTWSSIFLNNDANVLVALDEYIEVLDRFRSAIKRKDKKQQVQLMQEANAIKYILNKI